jgi:putative transposase
MQYLLELVRYIHLNPVRAKLVSNLGELDGYRFCGHGALMGKFRNDWQDTDDVLKRFGKRVMAVAQALPGVCAAGDRAGQAA